MNHEIYIRRTLELAQRGGVAASPNPVVGCCIVHQNRIIGEGWHERYGEAHAEVNAIASVQPKDRHLIEKSTLYVSLEPCCYHGNTPPCTDLILKHLIPKVVVCSLDPNPRISGGGVGMLRAQGVDVQAGILAEEGAWLNRRFFTFHRKKRPYIILKFAQSADGFISKKGEQTWISGKVAKRLSHKWRSEEDAILIGTNTAEIDNPKLTNRLWAGASPLRIVLDRVGRLSPKLQVFDDSAKTLIFSENDDITARFSSFANVDIIFGKMTLNRMLDHLYQQKIKSIIVEGGAQVLQSFISENLWDEARIFTAAHNLGEGISAPIVKGKTLAEKAVGKDLFTLIQNA